MALGDRILNTEKYSDIKNFEDRDAGFDVMCLNAIKQLCSKVVDIPVWFDYSVEEKQSLISNFVSGYFQDNNFTESVSDVDKLRLKKVLLNSVFGFGIIDLMLIKDNVKSVIVSKYNNICCVMDDNSIVESAILFEEDLYNRLIAKLVKLSGKDSPVIRFRINNFLLTILRKPVCEPRLSVEKLYADDSLGNSFLSVYDVREDVNSLLIGIFNSGCNIIISSTSQKSRDFFLNLVLNNLRPDKLAALFEEDNLIAAPANVERYNLCGLTRSDRLTVLDSVIERKINYICDATSDFDIAVNMINSCEKDTALMFLSHALSPSDAISSTAAVFAARLGITDKAAKTNVADYFDFVVHVDEKCGKPRILSLSELSTNKSGTPVIKELVNGFNEDYSYDVDWLHNADALVREKGKFTRSAARQLFVSRFED